jgi:ubiquinone/menaquinone biosynthesis C-methylase UbiE
MPFFPPLPRAADAVEMLDRPAPMADLARSLADLALLNRLFGGRRITLRHLGSLLAGAPRHRSITVLDVGTGSADLPRALARWARGAGRPIRIIALDRDAPTLEVARRTMAGYPEITLVRGDALALPIRSESVDVVLSALTLHHLAPEEAVRSLAEMDAAARRGLVVNDLARGRGAYALVWIATRVLASRMSRHDGPLSVRRAYTAEEARALCEKAGIFAVRVFRYPWLARWSAVSVKP